MPTAGLFMLCSFIWGSTCLCGISYWLFYLAIFGSLVAMVSYMALVRVIGADRSAYVDIVFPVITLLISTLFEGYVWTLSAVAGVLMILLGNYIAIRRQGGIPLEFSKTKLAHFMPGIGGTCCCAKADAIARLVIFSINRMSK